MSSTGEKLWQAAESGNKATVQSLLKTASKTDLRYCNTKSGLFSTPLTVAAHRGHLDIVNLLIAAGSDVNQQDPDYGNNALIWASVNGHVEICRNILKTKPNVNLQAKNGNTALLCACSHGHPTIARDLMAAGADPTIKNKDNETAASRAKNAELKAIVETAGSTGEKIWKAAEAGDKNLVQTLLRNVPKTELRYVNTRKEVLHSTALTIAAHRGHLDIVNALLAAGYDVNQQDPEYGNTALIWASVNGHLEVVRSLLRASPNVNLQAVNGNSALLCATSHGHPAIVRELLEAGGNPALRNKDNEDAVARAKTKEIKAILDDFAMTTGEKIWKAAEAGDKATVTALLKKATATDRRYVNTRKECLNSTALTIAAHRGHTELVSMLITAGWDVNQADPDHGNTALIWSSVNGHLDIVRQLLKQNPNVNHQAKNGNTALLCACSHGRSNDIVRELLVAGGNPSIRNKDNETAVTRASSSAIKAILQNFVPAAKPATPTPPSPAPTPSPTKYTPPAPPAPTPAPPAPPAPPAASASAALLATLRSECAVVQAQGTCVPTLRNLMRRRSELQQQFDAADEAGTDFKAIAALGKALKAVKQECADLPLSEDDLVTLPGRHAALVTKVTAKCKELRKAEDFDALESLATLLEALQQLDLTAAAPIAEEDDDGANDPVWVPNEDGLGTA